MRLEDLPARIWAKLPPAFRPESSKAPRREWWRAWVQGARVVWRRTATGLSDIVRTTTFRLALAQAAAFAIFAAALLGFVYLSTAGQLTREADEAAAQEFDSLAQVYAEGGLKPLNQEVIERAASGGPSLYVLADQSGIVISGDFDRLPQTPQGEVERATFEFDAPDQNGEFERRRARGRVGRLLNGPILLVARDMGDVSAIVRRISNVVYVGALVGLAFSLLAGIIASRQAARRAQQLSRTARDVMAGDLARRAPILGVRDEFDNLAKDLNAMLARLERLVHSTRTAGDAIAHDLRTPLTRMRQRLESALEHPPSEEDREALRRALEEADNLLATFNAVLRLARVQSAAGWRFEPVDVTAIALEMCEFYEPVAEDAGVTLQGVIAPNLTAPGDASLITQALSNLIENAIKYTPAAGKVEVIARRTFEQNIFVRVADSGPGVPEDERERVLERFVRLEAARTTHGAGLGLSLVAAVAELHKAPLKLEDGLSNGNGGAGLAVTLVLPAETVKA